MVKVSASDSTLFDGGRGLALPLLTQKRERTRKILKSHWCSNYFGSDCTIDSCKKTVYCFVLNMTRGCVEIRLLFFFTIIGFSLNISIQTFEPIFSDHYFLPFNNAKLFTSNVVKVKDVNNPKSSRY